MHESRRVSRSFSRTPSRAPLSASISITQGATQNRGRMTMSKKISVGICIPKGSLNWFFGKRNKGTERGGGGREGDIYI